VEKADALTRVLDFFESADEHQRPEGRTSRAGHDMVPIHAIYEGRRTEALFDPRTEQVDVVGGPLAGRSYRTPSGAAVDVVRQHNRAINPNRNGWSFWIVSGTGQRLISLRRRRATS
jgi:hypothetical protein